MSTRRAGSATVLWIGVVLSLHLGAVQAQSDALVHIRRGTSLPLDSTRVAVKIAAGRVDALESSLRERGLAPSSAKRLPLGDW